MEEHGWEWGGILDPLDAPMEALNLIPTLILRSNRQLTLTRTVTMSIKTNLNHHPNRSHQMSCWSGATELDDSARDHMPGGRASYRDHIQDQRYLPMW